MKRTWQKGQLLIELMLTIGLAAIILPGLLTGLVASREGRPQQQQRVQATALMKETVSAVRSARDTDWNTFVASTVGSPYYPTISSNKWVLSPGASTSAGFTKKVILNNVYRDAQGAIVSTGGTLDPSSMKADVTVSWTQPSSASLTASIYLTRTVNLTNSDTSKAEFDTGIVTNNVQTTTVSGGEVKLANNNKAKWCSPSFALDSSGNQITIDLPDGPPVAVAATASATSVNIPNDVFVATAPSTSSATKMAYVNVSANTATPTATLKGTFTLDPTKYSGGTFPGSLGTLTNNFKTNDVKYYTSASGKLYGLLATDDPNHEVVVVQIKSGGTDSYQDSTNKIYKYWTFFNTKIYSSAGTNDQSPYGYGAPSIAVLGTQGFAISGGYLYVFDLSNIDSASTLTSLPMVGCRIQLDGYDCKPGATGTAAKYNAGQSGGVWGDAVSPIHDDCSDGGNIELYADDDIYPVKTSGGTYVYVAVGGVTVPEFEIVNVSNIPNGTTNPTLTSNSCGRSSGGATGWKVGGTLDFNSLGSTEEAANSVYGNDTRAYISSNGGIDGNGDSIADSKQFYVIDTSTKTAPRFLTTSSSGTGSIATSGFYAGASPAPAADSELYPRRSLTVLNGLRAVLVGSDGKANSNNAEEYQVLELDNPNESTPKYCKGVDFNQGFNDLTSVSELDQDNYVYMIANTTTNELKIIEGGPDSAIYVAAGTYQSPIFDTFSIDGSQALRAYNRFLANIVQPSSTSIGLQMAVAQAVSNSCTGATYTYLGPNGTSATNDLYSTASIGTAQLANLIPLVSSGSYSNPGRCFRYKAYLTTSDQTKTPELDDITWNYSQ